LKPKEKIMSEEERALGVSRKWLFSVDTWAVLAAFLAALLIRAGAFRHIPW
jgi:hypothetical protein